MFELRTTTHLKPDEVMKRVEKATVEPLARCAALVEAEAKRILSTGANYTTVEAGDGRSGGRDEKGRYLKAGTIRIPDRNTGVFPRVITGNLRASIRYARTSRGTYLVGPQTVAWYGRVHEFGAVINATPKMRGYLKYHFGWTVRGGRIVIPKRPFMRPALARCIAKFPEQFRDAVGRS